MPDATGRPFWTGVVSFGLVNVPVGLMPASRALGVSMRMVEDDGTPLRRRYFSASGDKALVPDEIVRGYEVEKGKFVIVDDDELERLAPEKTGAIDLREFGKAADIDPVYFERGYYLVPNGTNTKAYRLLAQVMEDEELAGLATFVMRGKEYLVAITAQNGILRAETMRFQDEVRTPETIGLPKPGRVSVAAVKKMQRAIERLDRSRVDEDELVDRSAVRLLDVVEKKLEKGKDVVDVPAESDDESGEPASNVVDLMAALERSLKTGRKAASRAGRKSSRRRRVRASR